MPAIRLNKYLASVGLGSRRKIDQLVEAGQIFINGQPAALGLKIDPDLDEIVVQGRKFDPQNAQIEYYLLNKPLGVVSTTNDPQGRTTVIDLLKAKFPTAARVYPVGRLDANSEGLILLTNNGKLTYHLTHPKHHIAKTYQVVIKGILSPTFLTRLRQGIQLEEGQTAPCQIEVLKADQARQIMDLEITLYQGWKRQIRRMLEKFGVEVISLKRIAMGKISLDNLQPGEVIKLSQEQTAELF